jgi:hypothetical protein
MFSSYRRPTPPAHEAAAPATPGPCARRLDHDLPLHAAFRHLHRCGPRPLGHAVAELLDALGADPSCLDAVLQWRALDPGLVAAFGGDDFPRPPLRIVPR